MSEEEQFTSAIFADLFTFQNCPFCELFGTEVGILNAPEEDLRILSFHMRRDHGLQANDIQR